MTVHHDARTGVDQGVHTSRLRVVLLLDLNDGAEEQFLGVYEAIRHQVAAVPGHLSDQLCKSIEDPTKWLITSEWESPAPYLAWLNSPEHHAMVEPMHGCVRGTRSLRFSVARETGTPHADAGAASVPVARHALTFTVRPGSEARVAGILVGCTSPQPDVDALTRLMRTSVFMHGNRVVRAVEVRGDLMAALRHVAMQPGVREAEERLNPYLEEARDLADPGSARAFFLRAALPEHVHVPGPAASGPQARRALLYPVLPGRAVAAATVLADADREAAALPGTPFAGSTQFLAGDTLVRVVDTDPAAGDDPVLLTGTGGAGGRHDLSSLLALGTSGDLTTEGAARDLLAHCAMHAVTDRRAAPES